MFSKLFKLAALAVVIFVACKGMGAYAALKVADHMNECTSKEQLCQLVKRQASGAEVGAAMREPLACVKKKQAWFEPLFFPLGKERADPPLGSIDYAEAAGLCI